MATGSDVLLTFEGTLGGTIKADLEKVKADLARLTDKTYTVKMNLDSAALGKQMKSIQQSLTGTGTGLLGGSKNQIQKDATKAIKARAKAIEKALKASNARSTKGLGLGYDVTRDSFRTARRELQYAGLSYEATNKMTKGLERAFMQVGKVGLGFRKAGNDAERLVRLTVNGVDQMGNMVKIVREFDRKTGTVSTSKNIVQDFAKSQKVAEAAQKLRLKQLDDWNKTLQQSNRLPNQVKAGTYTPQTSLLRDVNRMENNLLTKPLQNASNQQTALGYLKSLRAEVERFNGANTAMQSNLKDRMQNVAKTISGFRQQDIFKGNFDKQIEKAESRLSKLRTSFEGLNKSFAGTNATKLFQGQLEKAEKQLQTLRGTKIFDEKALQNVAAYHKELDRLSTSYRNYSKAVTTGEKVNAKNEASLIAAKKQMESLRMQMQSFLSQNTRLRGTGYGAEINQMIGRRIGTVQDFEQIKKRFGEIRVLAKDAGMTGKTMSESFIGAAQKFGGWMFMTHGIMQAVRTVKQMFSNVVQLDTAMTALKRVTKETDNTYEQFFDQSSKRAVRLGATLTDTINASADFVKLGYDMSDAGNLAEAALTYKNVGIGIEDISEASGSLVSTMKAFGTETNDAMNIVDKFNDVGNKYAISSQGIGEAMVRSASAMAAAGNDVDETIALITAGNEIVQDPMKMGTTLKTVSMYLRSSKVELEEAGESTEGMAESVSKLRKELLGLTNGKVDIQLDENTYKSTYQILKELSEVWDELTDLTRASILEKIGGKHLPRRMATCA